jgi:16S rRNA (cytosine967-C5)-methyltransferase
MNDMPPKPEIQGAVARKAALRLIDAVLRRGETLEQAGASALSGLRHPADKALARAIAGEVLRWLVDLDALIDGVTSTRLANDAKARSVVRMMLAQWLRLDTPPHVVVATGLPLLTGGPRRLAHGVFGALARAAAALPPTPTLPERVRERWGARADAIARGLAIPPPLDLTLRDAGATEEWAERLGGISLASGHVRLARGSIVEELPGFAEGAWWVQDLAASLPARLLGMGEGRRVLDLCAAPGGKALQLASQAGPSRRWTVQPSDWSGCGRTLRGPTLLRTSCAPMRSHGNRPTCSTRFCLTPRAPRPAPVADIPMFCIESGTTTSPTGWSCKPACWTGLRSG